MTGEEIKNLFSSCGALLEGHFRLTSGKHSGRYIQCARVLQYPEYAEKLCRVLVERFQNEKIQVVVGPAMGGIVLAYELARLLKARALFMEREEGSMLLRRGFNIEPGERVLIAEDVITTGGSVMEVLNKVRDYGGKVVGVAVLVDRSRGKANLGVRKEALLNINIHAFSPDKCILCKQGVPLVKPGSRKI